VPNSPERKKDAEKHADKADEAIGVHSTMQLNMLKARFEIW
jgi:hypothetical protein